MDRKHISLLRQLFLLAPGEELIDQEYNKIKQVWLLKLTNIPLLQLKEFNVQTYKVLASIFFTQLIRQNCFDYLKYSFHFLAKFKSKKIFSLLKILIFFSEVIQNLIEEENFYEFLYSKFPIQNFQSFSLKDCSSRLICILRDIDFDISAASINEINLHEWFLDKIENSEANQHVIRLIDKSYQKNNKFLSLN